MRREIVAQAVGVCVLLLAVAPFRIWLVGSFRSATRQVPLDHSEFRQTLGCELTLNAAFPFYDSIAFSTK